MDILLVAAVLVAIIWVVARRVLARYDPSAHLGRARSRRVPSGAKAKQAESRLRPESETAVLRDLGGAVLGPEVRKVVRKESGEHLPPRPIGNAVEAWSPRTKQLEVAGVWYRSENLRTLFSRYAKVSASGVEIRRPAVLVPDPANPHDNRAVAVFVDGLHVGCMKCSDARIYHHAIATVPGGKLTAPSRQRLRGTRQETWARVTLSLPNPAQIACPNPAMQDCVTLPPGSAVQVTREGEHMEHLARLLERYGSETLVAASLRSVTERRPRSTVELVAVDIDAQQVGVLSTLQTPNFLPLVRRAETQRRTLTCRASIRGDSLKVDVALHGRKAHELDEHELKTLLTTA